jgi:hypothetical protein
MKKGINSIDIMVPSFLTLHYLSQKSSHSFLRGKEKKKYMKKKKKKMEENFNLENASDL